MKASENKNFVKKLTYSIRILLIVPAFILSLFSLSDFINQGLTDTFINDNSVRFEIIFQSFLALMLSFAPQLINKQNRIYLPNIFELFIVIFIYASAFLGDGLKFYYKFWWWDEMLHSISGIIIGLTGFLIVYYVNTKNNMRISPKYMAVFAFTFAVTLSVAWEVYEFFWDIIFNSATQQWDMPPDTIIMGKSFQGIGLRDTMSDLIVGGLGAIITSTVSYYLLKNEHKVLIKFMQKSSKRAQ